MSAPYVITEPTGTITVSESVLEQVVQRSAEQADGVRVRKPRRGLDVEIHSGRARVALEIAVPFGVVLPEAAAEVQRRVVDGMRAMCGLDETEVDVTVEELV